METFGWSILSVLLYIGIVIVIFLLLREINCWYWKINKRIELQQETNDLLKQILEKTKNPKPVEKNEDGLKLLEKTRNSTK